MVLALAATLLAPAAASAVTGHRPAGVTAVPDRVLVERFLPVARSYWPGSACAGRETVDVQAVEVLEREAGPGARGAGYPAECRVLLAAGLPPTELCVTLAHELGHLAGQDHAPSGLMSERSAEVGPCVEVAAGEEFAHEWRRAIAELPGGGAGWRVTRSRARREDGATAYVAARPGFLRRLILDVPASEASFRRAVIGPTVLLDRRAAKRGRRP